MAILSVQDQGAELAARVGALVVRRRGEDIRVVPLHEVEEVHLHGGVEITAGARNVLMANGIDTVFLTLDGRVRGRLVGVESLAAERRLAQYRLVTDDARRLALARAFVAGKALNQHAVLLSRQRHLRDEGVADALALLRRVPTRVAEVSTLDALRGVEGAAADAYFGVFDRLLRASPFGWSGRSRRPPRDPPNALLSYLYTLLLVRVESAVRAAGLDVGLGVLHEAGRGKPALALDLMEELRPACDTLALTLLNRRQLGPEDFGPPASDDVDAEVDAGGAVHLQEVGRAIVLREWARKLGERLPHPTRGDDWTMGALLREQALQVVRIVTGEQDEWRPMRLG